jgi:hypothetical protein
MKSIDISFYVTYMLKENSIIDFDDSLINAFKDKLEGYDLSINDDTNKATFIKLNGFSNGVTIYLDDYSPFTLMTELLLECKKKDKRSLLNDSLENIVNTKQTNAYAKEFIKRYNITTNRQVVDILSKKTDKTLAIMTTNEQIVFIADYKKQAFDMVVFDTIVLPVHIASLIEKIVD